ncbi:MAG: hypothetical protein EOM24_33355 [Chloroflexia bacterium]|nr:hypothetical protein [Chloroflexia bacterium]
MTITRTSVRNLEIADSYDIWPVDDHRGDGGGWMVVVFRSGFSSVISDETGPVVWPSEGAALDYLAAFAPQLERQPCDPGPREPVQP